jgi:hypothetical protein
MASKPVRLLVRFGDTKRESLAQRQSASLPWWTLIALGLSALAAYRYLPHLK